MPLIYHITTVTDWSHAQEQGFYQAASLHDEGFIHCSEAHQVAGVLERYFDGQSGLVKLVIDTGKLRSKLVLEWSPAVADTFPHVYGPIDLAAVVDIIALS